MVNIAQYLQVNVLFVTALLAGVCSADNSYISIFQLVDSDNLFPSILSDFAELFAKGPKLPGPFEILAVAADVGIAIAGNVIKASKGDKDAQILFYSFYNDDDWDKMIKRMKQQEEGAALIFKDREVTGQCGNGDANACRAEVLNFFTFALPSNRSFFLDAYAKDNNNWDVYVAGGDGTVVGECEAASERIGKWYYKAFQFFNGDKGLRELMCHVWGV